MTAPQEGKRTGPIGVLLKQNAKIIYQECYDLAMSVARSYGRERHSTAVMIATHILAAAKEAGHDLVEKAAM